MTAVAGITAMTKDDHRVDYLVNVEGLDMFTACRLVYAPDVASTGPLPPDPRTATAAEHSTWVRAWVQHLVSTRLRGPFLALIDARRRTRRTFTVRDLLERS